MDCGRHLLACGAELKNTFAVAKGGHAWVGHHVGDLKNYETLRSFVAGIDHFERLFAVEPEVVAHDLHPEYLSTKHALERDGVRLVGVQHHHAHLAACLAEHGERGPRWARSSTARATARTAPSGAASCCSAASRASSASDCCSRCGCRAARPRYASRGGWPARGWPRRSTSRRSRRGSSAGRWSQSAWGQVAELAVSGVASPLTTSAGRLFDAVAALCGVRAEVNYEGQAAVELEAACDLGERRAYPLPLLDDGGPLVIDARPTVRAVVGDLDAGVAVARIAARFHNALAAATARACALAAERRMTDRVVLSGGVFQNRRLLGQTASLLATPGCGCSRRSALPPNDGGIAYGQLAVAAARLAAEEGGADVRA